MMVFVTILVVLVCVCFILTLYSALIAGHDFDDYEDYEDDTEGMDDDKDE